MMAAPSGPHSPPVQRVLMTVDAVGGVWTYALDLARHLGSRGIEVLLACLGPLPTKAQKHEAASLPCTTLECRSFALEWMDSPWADVDAAGEWLLELAADFRPDVVHLNGYAHAPLPWGAPVVVVAHSCVASWWRAVKREAAPPSYDEYRSRAAAGLQAADVVVSPTTAMSDALALEYGPMEHTTTVWNGRTSAERSPQLKEPIIFSAGRIWDEAKNIRLLKDISPELRWPLLIAGETSADLEDTPHLQWLGQLTSTEMARQLEKAAVYAAPALYEPFGLGVLEAAQRGCALVLSDIPTFRELWDGCAHFVSPRDRTAWRKALNSLVWDPARTRALGDAACERAKRYDVTRMASRYYELYLTLCRNAHSLVFA